jgi:formylglycine-generating enzyme required for sulfatase activity
MNVRHNSWLSMEGACYGDVGNLFAKDHPPQYFWIKSYFIDIAEVTNEECAVFLKATNYQPSELTNFLKLWDRPSGSETQPWEWRYPQGKENHPVVWVDLGDARAYATWAGKGLPREEEWQYAAQGAELTLAAPFPTGQLEIFGEDFTQAEKACWLRERSGGAQYRFWPWGNTFDPSLCNGDSDDTTPVDQYLKGASLFGCLDMVGNVWEWTESERDDGHTRYAVIRGGSHRVIRGSRWYTASGAQSCDVHEKIPLMYPGLDRCSNIGFRCVKDTAE